MVPIDGFSLKRICLSQNNDSEFPIPLAVCKKCIFPYFNYISMYSLKGVSKTLKKCSEDLIEERSTKKVLLYFNTTIGKCEKIGFRESDYPNKRIWYNEVSNSIFNYLKLKMKKGENLAVRNALTFATTLVKPTKHSYEPQLSFFCCYRNMLNYAVRLRNFELVKIICGHEEARDPNALFEACKLGEVEILEVLIDYGVCMKKTDEPIKIWEISPNDLEKAFEIAKENGHERVIKYLEERFPLKWQFPIRCTIL